MEAFIKGQRVKLTARADEANLFHTVGVKKVKRAPGDPLYGVVQSDSGADQTKVRVQVEGLKGVVTYHKNFWSGVDNGS